MNGAGFPEDPYDTWAPAFVLARKEDPRIARLIHEALGDARSVVNVGAGAGAYEPPDREVVPVEPSEQMIARRPPWLAPAVRAHAESLPLEAGSVDASMACLSLHHWADWRVGVQEMRRVARERVVIFTFDPSCAQRFWLVRDYLPALARLDAQRFPTLKEQCAAAGEYVRAAPVPIPHDCEDGFLGAYWRRPEAYLDPQVQAAISAFALLGEAELQDGLGRLADDLASGRWERRNSEILDCEQIDLGYRLVVAELLYKGLYSNGNV